MRFFILLGLLLASSPASADVRAVYREHQGETLIVEVNDAGKARVSFASSENWSLLTSEGAFYVRTVNSEQVSVRYEDQQAFIENIVSELRSNAGVRLKRMSGWPLRAVGSASVLGRQGTEYRWIKPTNPVERNTAILSTQPDLQPLGRAFSKLILNVPNMSWLVHNGPAPDVLELMRLMGDHAPLRLDRLTMSELSFKKLSDSRFNRPQRILTREEWLKAAEAGF